MSFSPDIDQMIKLMRISRVCNQCMDYKSFCSCEFVELVSTLMSATGYDTERSESHIMKAFLSKLYNDDNHAFRKLEQVVLGTHDDDEISALKQTIAHLEDVIKELDTKITYMPHGTGYEEAKHDFESLATP